MGKTIKTFDMLQYGDMLTADFDAGGVEQYMVIEVFKYSVILQQQERYSLHAPIIRTIADLKRSPKIWSIVGYETEVTLTLDEIAEKFSVDPKRLRIKKGGM